MKMQRASKRRVATFESMEDRLLLATVGWDGPGLGAARLTYRIGTAPASLTQPVVDAAVKTALKVWSDAADITFVQTSRPALKASIDISFRILDGPGETLAFAFFPDDVNEKLIAGDLLVDASEVWEVGNASGEGALDLVYTLVHEIGHVLGLDHSDAEGSVMNTTVSSGVQFTGLAQSDVDSIRTLYAAPSTSNTPDPSQVITQVDSTIPRSNRFPARGRRGFPRPRIRMNAIEASPDAPARERPAMGIRPRFALA